MQLAKATFLGLLFFLALCAPWSHWKSMAAGAGDARVHFDVPSVLIAQSISAGLVDQPISTGRLVRIRIPFSLLQQPGFAGTLDSCVVQLVSPQRTLRIIDSWPKIELSSAIVGAIAVEEQRQTTNKLEAGVQAGLDSFGKANVGAKHDRLASTKRQFQRQPKLEATVSSGTMHRGSGAFFHFRRSHAQPLAGTRELAILAEVPDTWRGGIVQVVFQASGTTTYSNKTKKVAETHLWLAIHQEGDRAAAALANEFVLADQRLRASAASNAKAVEKKAKPTIFHQIGAALDVMEPRIPENYLHQVLFGPANQYLEGHSHRLPIDLRVKILDFWDCKESMLRLSGGSLPAAVPINVSKQMLHSQNAPTGAS